MRKLVSCVVAVAFAGLLFVSQPEPAQARMEYLKAFSGKYDKVKDAANTKKCGVCHGAQKKDRSDYAKAIEKALGAKMVKDMDKINKALDEAAKGDSGNGGKTYGDLLNDGTLPEPFKAAE
jgi:hypothetical protein